MKLVPKITLITLFSISAIFGLAANKASAASHTVVNRISIQGTGVVITAPDIAYINIGVSNQAKTAREALDKNNLAMNNIVDLLSFAQVENSDIQTSNFSINPRYDRSQNNGQLPKIIGYETFNTLNITIRDLDGLGDILDQVVTSGSNRIDNIRFAVANPQPLQDQARALAAKDALRRAQIYATTLGFELGNIVSITEGSSRSTPRAEAFMPQGAMMMDSMAKSTPIEAGEQAITSNVNIVWVINQ
ncbi:MAG: SIMPL domain-containing protein [Rhizobiales bacterium]|nr:SIMPL domain-containing protein [Hyphomicrobiales bacterium]NRB14037.1 SIMPL domain-containing protein [Hyphomicrobiales bacterium]